MSTTTIWLSGWCSPGSGSHGSCNVTYGPESHRATCSCPCHAWMASRQAAVDHGTASSPPASAVATADLWSHLTSGLEWERMTDEDATRAVRLVLDLGWRPRVREDA